MEKFIAQVGVVSSRLAEELAQGKSYHTLASIKTACKYAVEDGAVLKIMSITQEEAEEIHALCV